MSADLWQRCLAVLQAELSEREFNSWLQRLPAAVNNNHLELFAPNRFVANWIRKKYIDRLVDLVRELEPSQPIEILVTVGGPKPKPASFAAQTTPVLSSASVSQPQKPLTSHSDEMPAAIDRAAKRSDVANSHESRQGSAPVISTPHVEPGMVNASYATTATAGTNTATKSKAAQAPKYKRDRVKQVSGGLRHESYLNRDYSFDLFVPGPSNAIAHSSAMQVAKNPGGNYNPLYFYGPTGLGKTHLMHAIGNAMLKENPSANILYVHSERFFADMLKAIQSNSTPEFKRFYRSLDLLMIDDVQFFGGKKSTMEEFFHTFNALLEGNQQIVLTSDRFPKDIDGLEDRLKSRFNWGLTVAIEPPELELRVAILQKKAHLSNIQLDDESALFIAQRIRSNVRDLEGALKAVTAKASFQKRSQINVAFVQDALKDLLASHDKLISIDNIQRVVAEFYSIGFGDLVSKRRTRNLVLPRHLAMYLAKELTNHSLPEIGRAFGGRDHSTVLHANRKIDSLLQESSEVNDAYKQLKRSLGG